MANHASKKRAAKVRARGSDRLKPQVFRVVFDREVDGRWIAEVPELPGVMVYGESKQEALLRVQALAYRVIADNSQAHA